MLAHVPPPGYPALSLIAPDRTIYVGTFTNASGDANGPSHLYAYSPEGLMLRDWTINGQSPDGNNAIQVPAQDADGVLYLLDQQPPRVLAFDPHTGSQSTYATLADVPSCPPGGGRAKVWFTDPQLDGTMFGPAQIVMLPDPAR